jgi:hypothetical protein
MLLHPAMLALPVVPGSALLRYDLHSQPVVLFAENVHLMRGAVVLRRLRAGFQRFEEHMRLGLE